MAAPDVVYQVYSAAADTSNLVTPTLSPTPVNGDVLVIKMTTWDTANPMGTVSGGGQTYTTQVTAAPGGFNGWARIVTTTITGSPGAFAVTGGGTASNSRHSMIVEHYKASSGFSLAVTPAVAFGNGSGAPSVNLTTTGNGSTVSWCSEDNNSLDPVTRAYLLSATEDGIFDGHVGSNSVQYFAYATAGTAGVYTLGMSAPTPQVWVLAGIEILKASAATGVAPPSIVTPPPAVTRAGTW